MSCTGDDVWEWGELADDAGSRAGSGRGLALSNIGGENLDSHGAADHGIKAANDAAGGANAESFKELVTTDLHGDLPFSSQDREDSATVQMERKFRSEKRWY
jgi:hypothetical protein